MSDELKRLLAESNCGNCKSAHKMFSNQEQLMCSNPASPARKEILHISVVCEFHEKKEDTP